MRSIGAGSMGAYAYLLYWGRSDRTVDGEACSDRGRLYIEQWQWCSNDDEAPAIIWTITRRDGVRQRIRSFPEDGCGHVESQKAPYGKVKENLS